MALLQVADLRVAFNTPDGIVDAVRGLSFSVDAGRTLSLVGESGSGKSVSMQAIMGLIRNARISGQAFFDGRDLLALPASAMRQVRGRQISMVFQDPLSSLHPYYRIGWQITEMLRAHDATMSKRSARARAIELLGQVGIPKAGRRIDDYPHQFSGGMRQRAMIAMAIALNPKLLIADEPTTALDVSVQAQVLQLLRRVQQEFGTAIIFITHDLGVTAGMADEVLVMYAGEAMEQAGRRELFYDYRHPYTEGLLFSLPAGGQRERLQPIPGQPPSLIRMPPGCPFHPRCRYAFARCRSEQPAAQKVGGDPGHLSACWLPDSSAEA